MDAMQEVIKELNMSPEQMQELAETVKANPMAAFGLMQKMEISPEAIRKLVQLLMSNPQLLSDIAQKTGVSPELVAQVQANVAAVANAQSPAADDTQG